VDTNIVYPKTTLP